MSCLELIAIPVLAIGLLYSSVVVLGFDYRIVHAGESAVSHCVRCGYDLAGLRPSASCPECGRFSAGVRRLTRREWEFHPDRCVSVLLMAAPVLVVGPAVRWMWHWLYRINGWPSSLSLSRLAGDAPVSAMWGFALAALFVQPLAVRFGSRRRIRAGALTGLLGCTTGLLGLWLALRARWMTGAVYAGDVGLLACVSVLTGMALGVALGRKLWPPGDADTGSDSPNKPEAA